jgi:hypothetical protein
MSDFSNIPTGLKINSQIPLDVKGYALNEATLAYLGVDDNLAFTYHEGIRVICIEEKTLYEWREVNEGEENTGLIPVDFTYPSDLPEIYGIDYSNRTFNFFLIDQITEQYITNYVTNILNTYVEAGDLIDYNIQNINFSNSSIVSDSIYDSEVLAPGLVTFRLKGIASSVTSPINLTETTSGDLKNITLNFDPACESTDTISLEGNMSFITPFKASVLNPQKEITGTMYELAPTDDKYTIFINNGASNFTLYIPDILGSNFCCALYQEGEGEVTIQCSGTSTLNYPFTTLDNKIKGQNYWAMIERKMNEDIYFLSGNLLSL